VIVTKKLHFYAAHRNPEICGKCENIHGHRYGVDISVRHDKAGSVTIPFASLEDAAMTVVAELDHSLLLYSKDPAKPALIASGACGKVYEVPFQTSCENMAQHLAERLVAAGLNVVSLVLHETDTSSVTVTP
jgi:6-pyruvoyltetrahydropterin/6-carboxytetrahydropterin synthase